MKLTCSRSILFASVLFLVSACNLSKSFVVNAPVKTVEIANKSSDKSEWEISALPEGLFNPIVVFGKKGEIVLVSGSGIHRLDDEGKTWSVIRSGKGYRNCSRDGGKTYSADCDGGGTVKLEDIDISDATSIDVAVLTDDDRVIFSTVYEHTAGVWSVPLRKTQDAWFVLDFTYKVDDEETVYGIRHDMFSLGDRVVASAYMPPDERMIVGSDDGGKTWHRFYADKTREFHFIDDKTGFLLGDDIRKTTDGGASWTKVADMPTVIAEFEKNDREDDFSVVVSMSFADEKKGYMVGSKGFLIVTNDGGKTWERKNSGTANDLWGVKALDENHAWTVGSNGVVLETTDGGSNWNKVDLGLEDTMYSGLYESNLFIDKKRRTVWIIKDGNIYKKTVS